MDDNSQGFIVYDPTPQNITNLPTPPQNQVTGFVPAAIPYFDPFYGYVNS